MTCSESCSRRNRAAGSACTRIEIGKEGRHDGGGCINAARAHANEPHHQKQLIGQTVRYVENDGTHAPYETCQRRATNPEPPPRLHLARRWTHSVECPPLHEARDHPQVHNSHPTDGLLEARAREQGDAHETADDGAANEGGRHVPVLDAHFFGCNQQRALRGVLGRHVFDPSYSLCSLMPVATARRR